MKYLLDTHALLWYFNDMDRLSDAAVTIIEDSYVQKYVSVASLWEFSIKFSMEKLQFEGGLSKLWEMILENRFTILPVAQSHLAGIIGLPFIHRDPFDRLLVSAALAEGMTMLTADENIRKYDVPCAW